MLIAHLETCQSCAHFYHQLEQVVSNSPGVALPDEYLPDDLEALAKQVIIAIPQEKSGLMGFVTTLWPFGKKAESQSSLQRAGQKGSTQFPHVQRPQSGGTKKQSTSQNSSTISQEQEALSTSTRLRNISRFQTTSDDQQGISQGISLGSKFGVNVPSRQQVEEQPLTLAESIRRKVLESVTPPASKSSETRSNF